MFGVVIAVAAFKNAGEKLIIAPEGEIYYEPAIREKLSRLHNAEIESLSCLYEKSCGAIVIHKSGDRCKILLVRNHNGRNYSFPKGHVEQGETEEETAIREVKEETGLDITIIPSFREVADYCPFGKIRKRVVFFMAQTMSDKVHIQEEEIDSYIWVDLNEAHNRCTYDNDLRVIRKARENIHKLK
ncbi:MAG: NUDIX domain-containing protein [Ruminococcus sp.]|nr:NUDIX domain-containing protein [Ruminococcus sp.]